MRSKEYAALYMWMHATQDTHKGRKLSVAITKVEGSLRTSILPDENILY
jgi:hypothetical protein